MKHLLRDMSRPKALLVAGTVAGALAVSGAVAALNIGLLSSHASEQFSPEPIASIPVVNMPATLAPPATSPVEVVYEDVYEHIAAAPAADVPGAAPAPDGAVMPDMSDSNDDDDGAGAAPPTTSPTVEGATVGPTYADDEYGEDEGYQEDDEYEEHEDGPEVDEDGPEVDEDGPEVGEADD